MPNEIELNKKLKNINPSLKSAWLDISNKLINIYWLDKNNNKCLIYDFETERYNFGYVIRFLSTDEMDELQELVKKYLKALEIEQNFEAKKNINLNPFKPYTDHLAETLWTKNKAYGNSFSSAIDDFGLKAIGVQLSHKYNHMKHLVNAGKLTENGESLDDTLLDNAGYSILAYRYLKEHKEELENE